MLKASSKITWLTKLGLLLIVVPLMVAGCCLRDCEFIKLLVLRFFDADRTNAGFVSIAPGSSTKTIT